MREGNHTPPKFPRKLLKSTLKWELLEEVRGDMDENYNYQRHRMSKWKADLNYWYQTINYLRPFAIRNDLLNYLNPFFMWRHNLVLSWRNFKKNIGYSFINIFGLTAGLACAMLIAIFVRFEQSYDSFHTQYDQIYRIVKEDPDNFYLGSNRFAVTPAPLVTALPEEFPEVLYATQVQRSEHLFARGDAKAYEKGIYAKEDFFEVFTFPFLKGDPKVALTDLKSIILNETLANKYFPDIDPLGKILTLEIKSKKIDFEIAGIIEDVPRNSHLQFSYILPLDNEPYYKYNVGNWDSSSYLTYAALRSDHSFNSFSKKLIALAREKLLQYDYYKDKPETVSKYIAQPLRDIHLKSDINFEFGANGDIRYVKLFTAIALLILLIACINFINLTSAKARLRKQEIGVRKVIGAHRMQLVTQMLGETVLPALLASMLALLISVTALPLLNQLTDRQVGMEFLHQENLPVFFILVGLLVGLLAALYPASQLANQSMLVDSETQGRRKYSLRNALVVLQFAITIPLIVATMVIQMQLKFVQESDSGIDRGFVITVDLNDKALLDQYDVLREELFTHPGVLKISASGRLPTSVSSQSGISEWEGVQAGQKISAYHMGVKNGFVDLLGLNLVDGTDFSEGYLEHEKEEMLINQTMARQIGWKEPVGKWINLNGRESRVVGVLNDFNFLSLTQPMAPLALYKDNTYISYLLVKVEPSETQSVIKHLESSVAMIAPEALFQFEFLDEAAGRMYSNVVRLGGLFKYFTAIALILASLGLLGLAAFMAAQRTKEIGIRKVLGATNGTILALLNRDFLKLVLLGYVIALPIAWYASSRWLQDFAFRIDLSWWYFAVAGIAAIGVALFAVSSQSIRAAMADPVNAIKQEI